MQAVEPNKATDSAAAKPGARPEPPQVRWRNSLVRRARGRQRGRRPGSVQRSPPLLAPSPPTCRRRCPSPATHSGPCTPTTHPPRRPPTLMWW